MGDLTVDLDEIRRVEELRAIALLALINSVCLPEGTPTVDEIEDLSRQIDEALIRIDHDITRMENPQ